jgi:hypothetical protein
MPSKHWEGTRQRVRDWYALVERCRDTLRGVRDRVLSRSDAITLLLENHPELKTDREASNALDYVHGRKGRNARQ